LVFSLWFNFKAWFVFYIDFLVQCSSACLHTGLVETDPEGALSGFAEVVRMEQDKAEW
jgi:hypothetical protein